MIRKLLLALGVALLALPALAQVPPTTTTKGAGSGCNPNDITCLPGQSWYFGAPTTGPIPFPTPTTGINVVNQVSASKSAERITQTTGSTGIGIYAFQTVPIATISPAQAWSPAIAMFNLSNNTFLGMAIIDATFNTSTSGQSHDAIAVLPGVNADAVLSYGGISAEVAGTNDCMSSTGAGSGTSYKCLPFKVAMPTASPAAVAAATRFELPDPLDEHERWHLCWYTLCLQGGQTARQTTPLNGGGLYGENQSGLIFHFIPGSAGIFWNDTVAATTGGNGPDCPVTKCYEPVPSGAYTPNIGNATDGSIFFTQTPADATWGVYLVTAICGTTSCAAATAESVAWTLPNNGEPQAGGTCTITETTAAGETLAQFDQDVVNLALGSGATTGTGGSASATCVSMRTTYDWYLSPAKQSGTSGPAVSASAPGIVLRIKPCATWSANCDRVSTQYTTIPSAPTCNANCTVSGTTAGAAEHARIGGCKILPLWGQSGVCMFDVDNLTFGYYGSNYGSCTSCGMAMELLCTNASNLSVPGFDDYNATSQTWKFHDCFGGGFSCTMAPGGPLTSTSPTSGCGVSVPGGSCTGAYPTNCESPFLIPPPASVPGGMTSFYYDWDGKTFPGLGGFATPIKSFWDITNMPNGNLLFVFDNESAQGAAPNVWWCVVDTHSQTNDGCGQLDAANSPINGGVGSIAISASTGASGTMYILLQLADTAKHSCSGSCQIEYSAPLTFSNSPVFSYVATRTFGGGTAANAGGICNSDADQGIHDDCTVIYGTFSMGTSNVGGTDWYLP